MSAAPELRFPHPLLLPRIGRISMTGRVPRTEAWPADQPPRTLGSYAVIYLLAGEGRYVDGAGRNRHVSTGDLILLFPELPHRYGPRPGEFWDQLYLVFDGPVFDLWRASGLLDDHRPVCHVPPVERWTQRFAELVFLDEATTPGAVLQDIARLQLLIADALAAATADGPGSTDDQLWLARATALLASDLRNPDSLPDVAATLGLSYDGFRKRFRRLAGVTPARYRSQRRLDRACELIIAGDHTDREIAARLGFASESHFSHRFRQLIGSSPREFRAAAAASGMGGGADRPIRRRPR
jgi:AraC-like DNA-binding protein